MTAAAALAGALMLAACAQTPPPSSGLPTSGIYKVGKPYQINGVWYYPAEDYGYDETGIASWYGPGFHAKATANGEIYDEMELTAAHRTLPMPSLVRVTNLDNGRSIVVRVNDRGPFANNRVIDMSRRGAQLLGFEGGGTAKVRVQILAEESRQIAAAARRGTPAPMLAELDGPPPKAAPRGRIEVTGTPVPGPAAPSPGGSSAAVRDPATSTPIAPPTSVAGATSAEGRFLPAPVVAELPVRKTGQLYVQVGAFGNRTNLERARATVAGLGEPVGVTPSGSGGQRLQRVRLGPLPDVARADSVLARVIQAGLTDAKIIVD